MTTEREPGESAAAASKTHATEREPGDSAATASKSWRALGSAMANVLDEPMMFFFPRHGDMSPEGRQAHTTEREPGESMAAAVFKAWRTFRVAGRLSGMANVGDVPMVLFLNHADVNPEGRQAHATEREQGQSAEEDEVRLESSSADIDAILERLDHGIAAEQVAMDRLLERIVSRTPR